MTQAPPSTRSGIAIAAALGLVVLAAVIFGITRSSNDPPPAPPAPETTEIYMVCVPPDATVTRVDDGTLLGRTPLTMHFPKGNGQVTVIVHHDGYRDRRVDIPLFSATGRIDVELTGPDASTEK